MNIRRLASCSFASALLALSFLCAFPGDARAFDFLLSDGPGGATCDDFNAAARIKWRTPLGDWVDAKGVDHGPAEYASASIPETGAVRVVEWDLTALAKQWADGSRPVGGLLLKRVPGTRGDEAQFFSREIPDASARPRLVLTTGDGKTVELGPIADTRLRCSTVYSLGQDQILGASDITHSLLQFDPKAIRGVASVTKAVLVLTAMAKQYGTNVIGVYALSPPGLDNSEAPQLGLANRYSRDKGIAKDPDVIMAESFQATNWRDDWSPQIVGNADRVESDAARKFKPIDGAALSILVAKGSNYGVNLRYKFTDKHLAEPEEVYFRYYLRLGDDWDPSVDGGKLPGISGTYGKAGWGGRKADGKLGWSMRGAFYRRPEPGSPYHDLFPIGTYAYHDDTEDVWGDSWPWSIGQRGLLERNRWYCIEQYMKVNTPGKKDAIFRAWVDGRPALDKTGFRVRDIPSIRIEDIWVNVYHGGTAVSQQDQHLYIDNVVIARRYIGPIKE